MGKYTFTWEHSAQEVYVTGTFDDWRKTVQLEKEDDGIFKKAVELPKTHTQYKFVVDGNWCTNDSARKEDDGHGIVNNVLLPEDIVDEPAHTMSSAAPAASTAALAGAVPKESEEKATSDVPGAFPETPYAETPGSEPQTFNIAPIPATAGLGNPIHLAPGEPVPHASTLTDNTVESMVSHDKEPAEEVSTFGVAPLPATAGAGNPIHLAPGEPVPHASTLTDNTVESMVSHDKEPAEEASIFGVAPLPATAGAGNPIQLAPGETVPHPSTFTSNTVDSTATTDASSYERSDALPPLAFTPQAEREAKGGMFGLPPIMGNMIPESSLPMGADAKVEQDTGYTIQSAAPTGTTAQLAAQVPKEPRGVPETVTESQKEAGVEPEAAANSEAVQEKKEMEQELKETVPEAPVTADNSYASNISSHAGAAAVTAAAGATAGAGLFAAAIYSAKEKAAETVGMNGSTTADEVPSVVAESQSAAHADPEAAASPEVVAEKSQMEQELLSQIPKTNETGLPAPAVAIPEIVSESQKEAHVSPEAASSPEVVAEKKAMESELLSEIPKTNEAGEPAPAFTAATNTTAPEATTETLARDVPDVVAESQHEAHASPEAAANNEAVAEKSAVESELLSKLPRTDEVGEPAPVATAATTETAPGTHTESLARDVPDVVAESQHEAHASPEAAANSEAVAEKSAVESELLSKLPPADEAGEPVPVLTAATTETAPGIHSESLARDVPDVPDVVTEAHASPDAATFPEVVSEKRAAETELMKEVPTTDATAEPAPSASAIGSQDAAGLSDEALVDSKPMKSSSEPDVLNAPASKPAQLPSMEPIDPSTDANFAKQEPTTTEQTQPTVTTGLETSKTEATSSAPSASASAAAPETPKKDLRKDSDVSPKGTPGSQSIASAVDDKKKKRRSIFGKIKDKLTSKDKN
ncbi:hypothetical protein EJ02DRAFT_458571 [Clathrospora elynae]|uniref:AMP-activated protein kinase glycogen-binding domain-containing protein n=1 Tax=Clathrospora elynae TaxID=706981 RepID=A0A6A5SDJ2_9PLEO|nr:hypothetical protein EJ02DRAFT_458571 [Clathrospora elynae]